MNDALSPCDPVRPTVDIGFEPQRDSQAVGARALDSTGYPMFSNNVPIGALAPPEGRNTRSIDFGPGGNADGGRAIDFDDSVASQLDNVTAFTITGWVNLRSSTNGQGGNRIFSTYDNTTGKKQGIDLVYDGQALRLGINSYSDMPTVSIPSAKVLTISADGAPSNWVFFAVTYDANNNSAGGTEGLVSFYFGDANTLAKAKSSARYASGGVGTYAGSALAVGNFLKSDGARYKPAGESRAVRGYLDELRFFGRALTPPQIQCQQIN
jgi:hypothetical protein